MLNRLNDRVRADAIRVASAEVERSRTEALAAQDRLTEYRRRIEMIDPTELSKTVLDTIAALSLQAVEAAAQIDITREASPNSPQLAPLNARLRAVRAQIELERASLAGSDSALANKVADYERLAMQRDFAEKSFVSALTVLEAARLEAARQQAFLERIVEPRAADKATAPLRAVWTGGAFFIGLGLLWLFRPERAARAA